MKALVTGASSGIGRDIAIELAKRDIELILVGRNEEALRTLKEKLNVETKIIVIDLAKSSNCQKLYEMVKHENIDILINNAGFGLHGSFCHLDLGTELDMINVNIKAVHILMKLFLNDFIKKDSGYILNVASAAAFLPGPLMATYYATKAYVVRLTQAVDYELKIENKNVYIGALCPGPVKTKFEKTANVKFKGDVLSSPYVAKYAVKQMFNKKKIIVPSFKMQIAVLVSKFISTKTLLKVVYRIQNNKKN